MVSFTTEEVNALCSILGDTNKGFTKSELKKFLILCNISPLEEKNSSIPYAFYVSSSKKDYLNDCFQYHIEKKLDASCVAKFIEKSLSPILYTDSTKRQWYTDIVNSVNKVLLMKGLILNPEGKIIYTKKANTLDEVDERLNNLTKHLRDRYIHAEVLKYCIKDYLRNDYYDTVFEASKGLAQRVREMTGLTNDGGSLFQKALSIDNPYIALNTLRTITEKNEQIGLSKLLEAIFNLVRNPAGHTPKINWKSDLRQTLDVLTLISFSHKYLDTCIIVPHDN